VVSIVLIAAIVLLLCYALARFLVWAVRQRDRLESQSASQERIAPEPEPEPVIPSWACDAVMKIYGDHNLTWGLKWEKSWEVLDPLDVPYYVKLHLVDRAMFYNR
jgi:hypothetical protein